ncbi:MAG: phospholipase [Actinobacteria bacterium]|nr:phospholipase [Actinomycetota bacterium]
MQRADRPLAELPERRGDKPRTGSMMPHTQLDQNAPVELQELLFERITRLSGVTVAPSRISVPGARAFVLEDPPDRPEAFLVQGEFAHLHPPTDGSLHLMLSEGDAAEVIAKGWGELHPAAREGLISGAAVMVFGPRDEDELEVVAQIVQASYRFAGGDDTGR